MRGQLQSSYRWTVSGDVTFSSLIYNDCSEMAGISGIVTQKHSNMGGACYKNASFKIFVVVTDTGILSELSNPTVRIGIDRKATSIYISAF